MKKLGLGVGVAAVLLTGALWFGLPRPTYTRDIAPLVLSRCAICHHAGGAGPFPLTTYAEVRARAGQIADVTASRRMPPWLPERGCADFDGDRSLADDQIARIRRWVDDGAPKGSDPEPAPPAWNDGWQLGKPDLVLTPPEPFLLAADGPDVYRNFVIPVPGNARRYVRGLEFQPGLVTAVHHAFLFLDPTKESQRRDLRDAEPGFPGLHVPSTAQAPAGHFLSWQPGKRYLPVPEDLAWALEPGSFLVLQVHLRPSGKPERIQPSAGFFFTGKPPTRALVKFGLWSNSIDLPAGNPATVVKDEVTLPLDLDLLRISLHAHFLCRRMEVTARLPDGSVRVLMTIPAWDFNWQGDYVYREPVFLPQGTAVSMAFTYDNSDANPRNPHRPAARVRYGLQSDDEMAEVWIQALPRRPADVPKLDQATRDKVLRGAVVMNRSLIERDPDDAQAHAELGKVLLFLGEAAAALPPLDTALRLRPDDDDARYYRGLLHRMQDRLEAARVDFEAAIRSNPEHQKAHGNLGLVLMSQGRLDDAVREFETALRLNPADEIARSSLQEIAEAKRKK